MPGILTSGPDYFPGWVSVLFTLGLALGILHHLPCLVLGRRDQWFHAGHAAMALSMIYMYLSMSYDWNWLPAIWQMWFFIASAVTIATWLLTKFLRGQPVNFLWMLLLMQQAAMAYMWYPMMKWNPILIFVLVSWFAIEAFGWAANLFPDDVRIIENRTWFPYELGATASTGSPPAADTADRSGPETCECGSGAYLIVADWKDRTLMTIMALSMGYMFFGMQMLR